MFTGIISAIGKVVKYDGTRLGLRTPYRQIQQGESISIDGVCLTVTKHEGGVLFFDVGPETRRVTSLGRLKPGYRVNLERALRVGDRVGGHWVAGHVESVGRIRKVEPSGHSRWVSIEAPKATAKYLMPKGSIAVDGISLTVADLKKTVFRVMIIPHTLQHTTLGSKRAGEIVNLEPDLLAKYAERLHVKIRKHS